jgi:hypothetical protein
MVAMKKVRRRITEGGRPAASGSSHKNTIVEPGLRFGLVYAKMRGVFMADKEHAYELIDRLPPTQLSAVVGLLEAMLDPVSRAIANAPCDDEPVTAEEEKSLAEAREWLKHNKAIPHEQVLAELGITQEEIEHFKYEEPK